MLIRKRLMNLIVNLKGISELAELRIFLAASWLMKFSRITTES